MDNCSREEKNNICLKSQDTKDAQGDYATVRVPGDKRRSMFNIAIVQAGYCIVMSGLYTGAAISAGLGFWQSILAIILGNAILTVYSALMGIAGAREGVSTSVLARHSFGRDGSKLVGLVAAITMLGWYAVQVGFFGETMHTMFPGAGFITSVKFAGLWGGILMMITAYHGYKGLATLSKIAVPAIIGLSIWGITLAVSAKGGWGALMAMKPTTQMTLGSAAVLIVGSFAGGGACQADITRYAKDAKSVWVSSLIGYLGANSFIIVAGMVTSMAVGSADLPYVLLQLGLGIPALIVLISAQWTSNDNNLYTASLGFSNLTQLEKNKIVIILGIIATIVGVMGMADYFIPFLTVLGIAIPPMAGIIIADYYIVHKGSYKFGPGTKYSKINFIAILSWIIATIVGFVVTAGIQSFNSLICAFVLYIALGKLNLKLSYGEHIESDTGF